MNKDQVSGKFDQATGKVKEKIGEAAGNQRLANKGLTDQIRGAAKETWGNAKDVAHQNAEENRREAERDANASRERVANKVQDMKERVNERIDQHRKSA
ncbi:CsbD family protein [Alloacidobacterium sp.]|uniref:CsbD family protein n=1 Tax=Alloacidobacterium sp. TaxID=2951999 RepID=UPI002D3A5B88|nr:CsbD family protein [Alloacidobacterium sp.]HYK37358.1 CsbD family protein [Alloacidobacterium sp.]